MSATTTDPDRERLRKQFLNQPPSTHISHWETLWSESLTPWDRSGPSLALKDALLSHPDLFGPAVSSPSRRRRALVPGCGRGYDVLLLAALGFDAVGVDASPTAVQAAEEFKTRLAAHPDAAYLPPAADSNHDLPTPGSATFLQADFFQPLPHSLLPQSTSTTPGEGGDASEEVQGKDESTFDLIFDYTFLCALPPSLRPAWSARMHALLTPRTGRLVCLEWPLHKPAREGGPPHGLEEGLYAALLGRPGAEVEYDGEGKVVRRTDGADGEADGKGGVVRLARWMPERTHEAGKGKDYVSVWMRSG